MIAANSMDHMESVSFGIWVRAGVRYEDANNNGITHLLEHLLFKGTEKRDMKKIKAEIEIAPATEFQMEFAKDAVNVMLYALQQFFERKHKKNRVSYTVKLK